MRVFKLKAGALQLTLFVVIVVALLLSGFIMLIHTQQRYKLRTTHIIEAAKNAKHGIDYALVNTVKLNDSIAISFPNEDYKSITVSRHFWGVFEIVKSQSKIKNNGFNKVALTGALQPKKERTALYLQDNNKPLVLVGNTKIEGMSFLPEKGVKSGAISGESFYGSQLIYGNTKKASALPALQTETANQIKIVEGLVNTNAGNVIDIEKGKSYSNSFLKPLKIVYNTSTLRLANIKVTGHIIIQSKTKIVVERSTQLKDVVLIAPEIEIKPYTKGTFQAIASKTIKVGNNCNLKYPSALVVAEQENVQVENIQEPESNITLEPNTILKGIAIYLSTNTENTNYSNIKLEPQSSVYGEVYCNKNIELQGAVYGSVFTNNFVVNHTGSIYQNHIYNGNIIVDNLPEEYTGLLFNDSKKGIIKWLY